MDHPDSSSILSALKQASLALQRGDLSEAAGWAKEVIHADPENIRALLILAYCSSPYEGMAYLRRAEEIAPGNPSVEQAIRWGTQRIEQAVTRQTTVEAGKSPASGQEDLEDDEEITRPVMLHPETPPRTQGDVIPRKETRREIHQLLARARLKSVFQVGRFLVSKALLILATIFIGVFITILIANRPINTGYGVKPPPLESSIMHQVDMMIRVFTYNDQAYQEMSIEEQQQTVAAMQERFYENLGMNLPYLQRNLKWTFYALRFNWGALERIATSSGKGFSFQPDTISQNEIVLSTLPNTILLAASANLFIFLLGIPLALLLSRKQGTWFDRLFTFLTPVFSIPSWVIGIVMIAIFAVLLKILPVAGMYDIRRPEDPLLYILMVLKHMILPVTAIVLSLFFQLVYSWRTYFMIYSEEDYVTQGVAQGLNHRKLQNQYILRPGLSYIITTFTLMLVSFWQMTMALEVIFSWPGVGLLFIKVGLPNFWGENIYPGNLIIAITVIVIFAYLLGAAVFLLDIAYVLVDPRIHLLKSEPILRQRKSKVGIQAAWGKPKTDAGFSRIDTGNFMRKERKPLPKKVKWGDIGTALKKTGMAFSGFIKTLWHYPSAVLGFFLILFLLVGSLYALIFLPYEKIGAEWGGSRLSGQAEVPALAKPTWVNLFKKDKYLSRIILESDSEKVSKEAGAFEDGLKKVTYTYTFNYEYADFPQEVFLYLSGNFDEKQPLVTLTWITPDGREFKLKSTSVDPETTYNFDKGLNARKLVSQNENWQKWFVFGDIFPTPEHYLLFADPDAETARVVKGNYTLRMDGFIFEEGSEIQSRLVLLGQVFGIAGTDRMRRDLLTPLLWGMPVALGFGLVGALITTIISMFLSAAGVWFGGWVDSLIQRLTEVNLVLPILAICVMAYAFLGLSLWLIFFIVVILNVFGSPVKNFRSAFLNIKDAPYIEGAQAYGASSLRIITKYMVPRIIPVLIPQLIILIPSYVFLEVTLGLFNISTGLPTWGTIIYQALTQGALYYAHYRLLEPLAMVLITGIAFSLFGFSLERILNPRLQSG